MQQILVSLSSNVVLTRAWFSNQFSFRMAFQHEGPFLFWLAIFAKEYHWAWCEWLFEPASVRWFSDKFLIFNRFSQTKWKGRDECNPRCRSTNCRYCRSHKASQAQVINYPVCTTPEEHHGRIGFSHVSNQWLRSLSLLLLFSCMMILIQILSQTNSSEPSAFLDPRKKNPVLPDPCPRGFHLLVYLDPTTIYKCPSVRFDTFVCFRFRDFL